MLVSGLVGVLIGIFMLAFFAGGVIYDFEDTVRGDALPPVDAIICLAGGKGRIPVAADLWYRYWTRSQKQLAETVATDAAPVSSVESPRAKVPVLFISGAGHRAAWSTVSRPIRPEVLKVLTARDVIVESFSENTDENAKWVANYVGDKKWKRILLVTSSYHMRRAKFIFSRVLEKQGPVQIETYSVVQEPFLPWHWHRDFQGIQVTMTEFLKWVLYQMFWSPE